MAVDVIYALVAVVIRREVEALGNNYRCSRAYLERAVVNREVLKWLDVQYGHVAKRQTHTMPSLRNRVSESG